MRRAKLVYFHLLIETHRCWTLSGHGQQMRARSKEQRSFGDGRSGKAGCTKTVAREHLKRLRCAHDDDVPFLSGAVDLTVPRDGRGGESGGFRREALLIAPRTDLRVVALQHDCVRAAVQQPALHHRRLEVCTVLSVTPEDVSI